jgi:predicted DCC family thiol-disulfide oxidoreductase YuxK
MDLGSDILSVPGAARPTSDILFFDGVCGLCHRLVQFVLREDREHRFLLSPLQGATMDKLKRSYAGCVEDNTMLVLRFSGTESQLLARSDAALYVLSRLPRFKRFARLGLIFPRFIRDAAYRAIATVRYNFWGRSLGCRLPSEGDLSRFLP